MYLVLIMVFTPPELQISSPVSLAASQKLLYVTSAMNVDMSGPTAPTGFSPVNAIDTDYISALVNGKLCSKSTIDSGRVLFP